MNGILIINKPEGLTSHDVVARVRRILRERRVGHTGTLDPFATGVLVVLVGRATRLAQFLAGAEKEYVATIRFGYHTDTGDRTGTQLAQTGDDKANVGADADSLPRESRLQASDEEIETALALLRGQTEQVPPMYSAKKIQGRKLYELARQGREVERAPVSIFVREFEVVRNGDGALLHENTDGTCDLRTRVVCSAGTYVRVLAESVGERLGTGAHLAELRRTRAGAFHIEDALTLEALQEAAESNAIPDKIISPGAALSELPVVHLTNGEVARARHGVHIAVNGQSNWNDAQHVRMEAENGELIAVGVYNAERRSIHPRVLLVENGNMH